MFRVGDEIMMKDPYHPISNILSSSTVYYVIDVQDYFIRFTDGIHEFKMHNPSEVFDLYTKKVIEQTLFDEICDE